MREVDTKVVEMQFNNKQFEENVKESMATLKALKKQIEETESAKGLTGLSNAINNIDVSGISKSIGKIEDRFSTMGIVGMTIVQNLTNTALRGVENVAQRMFSMIKAGGISRASNIEQAKFQLKGLNIAWNEIGDAINFAVADTAYGLDSAALAASTLAASGVSYKDSVIELLDETQIAANGGSKSLSSMGMALKAISGVAAQTNSDYASMANIFGTVAGQGKLMTMQLRQLETRGLNAAAKIGEVIGKTEAEVRTMVTKGQIDFKTFSDAMYKQFADHASDANKTLSGVSSNVRAAFSKIGAAIISPIIENEGPLVELLNNFKNKVNGVKNEITETGGFTETLSNNIIEVIKYANSLLSKVDPEVIGSKLNKLAHVFTSIRKGDTKDFITSDAVITADTYTKLIEKLGGDSKTLQDSLMDAAKAISGIDVRSKVKEYGSFTATLKDGWLTVKVWKHAFSNIKEKIDAASKSVNNATKTVEELDKVASKVIRGDFGNGQARIEALTKAGYNWAVVQNRVNEMLGCTVKHATDLSEAELISTGLTAEQAKKFKELADKAENADKSISDILELLAKPSASDLLFLSLANVLSCVKALKKAATEAWKEMFPGKIDFSNAFYSFAKTINKLSEAFIINDEKADKLKRTFKGVYAIADVIRRVINTGLTIAFKTLNAVLENLHLSIFDVIASAGDAAVAFREWYIQNDFVNDIVTILSHGIVTLIKGVKTLVNSVKESESIQNSIKIFQNIGTIIKNIFTPSIDKATESVNNLEKSSKKTLGLQALETILSGLAIVSKLAVTGISVLVGAIKSLINSAKESTIISSIINTTKSAFEAAWTIIKPIIDGLLSEIDKLFSSISNMNKINLNGLVSVFTNARSSIINAITGINKSTEEKTDASKSFGGFLGTLAGQISKISGKFNINLDVIGDGLTKFKTRVSDFIKGINVKEIVALSLIFGEFFAIFKIVKVLGNVASTVMAPFEAFGGLCTSLGKLADTAVMGIRMASLIMLGIAVSILVGSINKIMDAGPEKMLPAVIEMIGVIGALALLSFALSKIDPMSFSQGSVMIMELGASVGLIAIALAIMTRVVDGNKVWSAVKVLGVVMLELAAFTILLSKLAPQMSSGSVFLLSFSASILLLSVALNALLLINVKAVNRKLDELAGLFVLLGLMMISARLAGKSVASFGLGMIGITTSLLVVVGILKVLSLVDMSELSRGMLIVTMLSTLFILIGAASRLAGETAGKSWKEFLAMAGVITLMIGMIIIINLLSMKEIAKGLGVITAISVLLGALMLCASEIKENNLKGLAALAGMLLILVGAIVILSQISDIKTVLTITGSLISLMAALALLAHIIGNMKVKSVVRARHITLMLSGLLAELAGIIIIMSNFGKDSTSMISAAGSLSLMMLAMVAGIKIMATVKPRETENVKKTIHELGIIMLAMGAMITAMTWLIKDPQSAIASSLALSMVLLAIAGSMRLLTNIKGHSKTKGGDFYKQLYSLVGIVWLIGVVLTSMSQKIQDPVGAIALATALDTVLIALTGCAIAISKFSKGANLTNNAKVLATMLGLEVVLAGLGAVLRAIDFFTRDIKDVTKPITILYALIPVLAALAALSLAIGLFSGLATMSIEGVAAISLCVVVLGATLAGLAGLLKIIDIVVDSSGGSIDKSVQVMYQLVGVLAVLSVLAIALGALGIVALGGFAGAGVILILELAILGLAKLLEVIGGIQNADKSVEVLQKLVGLLAVMTLLVGALGVFGMLAPFIVAGEIAMAGLEVLLLGLIGLMGMLTLFSNPDEQVSTLAKLVLVLEMMAIVVKTIASAGPLVIIATPVLASLMVLLLALSELAVTMGTVFTIFSGLDTAMDKGIEVLIKMADGLGQMVGILIENIGGAIADTLPNIGAGLGAFALLATPFFTAMGMIPPNIGTIMAAIGAGIIAMFAGDVIDKIVTFITGESSLESFGTALVSLGDGLKAFAEKTETVKSDGIKDKALAIKYLAQAACALPKSGGLLQDIIGTSQSLTTFAEGIEAMAPALETISKSADNVKKENVEKMGDCVKALAEAANELPTEDGLLQAVVGNTKNLKEFADELTTASTEGGKTIGEAVVEISKAGGNSDFKKGNVKKIAEGITALGDAAKSMVTDGGFAQSVLGHAKNLKEFASELSSANSGSKTIGQAIMDISNCGAFVNPENVERISQCITLLNDSLPTEPTVLEKWFGGGKMTMSKFGEELNDFAEAMKTFVSSLGECSFSEVNKVDSITQFIDTLSKATGTTENSMLNAWCDATVIDSFCTNLVKFGQGIADYSAKVKNLDNEALTKSVYGVETIGKAIDKMAESSDSVDKAKVTMTSAGSALIEALCSSITTGVSSSKIINAAKDIMEKFANNISFYNRTVLTKFEALATGVVTIFTSPSGDFLINIKNAGRYFTEGLREGIQNENAQAALYKACSDMGKKCVEAVEEATDEHSPSKETRRIGRFFDKGLELGIRDYASLATNAAANVGEDVVNVMNNSINNIATALENTTDFNPTITPVLDLSNVGAGIGTLNSLIDSTNGITAGVSFNTATSIGRRMNQSNVRATNDDIVSSLDKLGNKLEDISANNYTINGITYGDDSAVAGAIRTLINATIVEGRV